MASRVVAALVIGLAVSAVVLMVVGVWGYMATATSVYRNPTLEKLVPSLPSYRAIVWKASEKLFENLAKELNATTGLGSSPIEVSIVDLCTFAKSPYLPRSGSGVLAIDTGKCSVDTYALTYHLIEKLWNRLGARIELIMHSLRAIAVVNSGNNIVVAVFSSVPTKSAALLLQLAISIPVKPKPQLLIVDVGNESSRASAIALEKVGSDRYVISTDLYMVAITSLVSIPSGGIELRCVGPLKVISYEPSSITTSGGLVIENRAIGNIVLLGVRKVVNEIKPNGRVVSVNVEPIYSAMVWVMHGYAELSLSGKEARALLSLNTFGSTTLAAIVFGS